MAKRKSKTGVVKAKKKGQRTIRFKKGALTAAARRSKKSISEYCENPPTKKAKARCNFRKNVLTGRKKRKR